MSPNMHLIIHDVVGVLAALVITILAFFVLLKDRRKTVNVTLGLTFLAAVVAIITNIIGVSVADTSLSYSFLTFNLFIILAAVTNYHCVMAMLDKESERRDWILFVYLVGAFFAAWFMLFPETFMGLPEPKMYFANYYTPGSLHWVFNTIFKIIIPVFFITELAHASSATKDRVQHKRFLYFTIALILGWGFAIVPTFLTYDIMIDPLWGMLFPIVFAIPFIYAIFKYELLDIRVVAKKAFLYAGTVIAVGVLIGVFNITNRWMETLYPDFPVWAMPLILSILIVGIGVLIWQQLRETEILKYEFITTVTHKFRTPLTHIKWATENLKTMASEDERREQLGYIEDASSKLVELTDLLANTSEPNDDIYRYRIERANFSKFVAEITGHLTNHANTKKITLQKEIRSDICAMYDETRLKFVVQTFIENAINYTNEGGTVTVRLSAAGHEAIFSVKDTGIGIPKNELSLISTKLYRGARARVTDTEGMGIGLFMSRGVIARHHGRMIVESDGEGKGSTFSFTLPLVR